MLRILLWWDTEDYINPESDDALLLLMREHLARGVPAVFKIVGERSRVLRQRGRRDIVDLMAEPLFEIGYHTDFHSAHPTIGEYTENLDWGQGVAEVLARESAGLEDTLQVLDKPALCYGQPGASYTPHAYGAMRVWGIPAYLGNAVYLGLPDRPCYVAGRLSIADMAKANGAFPARMGEEAFPFAQRIMRAHLESPPAGGLISQGGHPNEWSLREWWDEVNFFHGASPDRADWRRARTFGPGEMARWVALYGQYLGWLRDQGVEPVSLRQLFADLTPGDGLLDGRILADVAQAWSTGEVSYHVDESAGKSYSAAQLLYGLCAAVADGQTTMAVPEIDAPTRESTAARLSEAPPPDVVHGAASQLVGHVRASGALPSDLEIGPGRMDLRDLATGVAALWLGRGTWPAEARLLPAESIRVYGRDLGPWSIHRPDFTGEILGRLTKLLAWTLKPAVSGSPGA